MNLIHEYEMNPKKKWIFKTFFIWVKYMNPAMSPCKN